MPRDFSAHSSPSVRDEDIMDCAGASLLFLLQGLRRCLRLLNRSVRLKCLLLFLMSGQMVFCVMRHVSISERLEKQQTEIETLQKKTWEMKLTVKELQILLRRVRVRPRLEALRASVLKRLQVRDPVKSDSIVMVVGILTSWRQPSTVLRFVEQLMFDVDRSKFKFIVFQSLSIAEDVEGKILMEDWGATVYRQTEKYQELAKDSIPLSHGDSKERVMWRTNHVLDYVKLLELCVNSTPSAPYILILEDDLLPSKGAIEKAYQFASEKFDHRTDWGILTFYSGFRRTNFVEEITHSFTIGAVSLLYSRHLAQGLIGELRQDPFESPVDLIIPHYVLEKRRLSVFERTPNLFQHLGVASTYTGKDTKKRKSEEWRSRSFMRDEDDTSRFQYSIDNKTGYIGCFRDSKAARDLNGLFALSEGRNKKYFGSVKKCREFCRDYFYFGLQYGGECYCGNEFGLYGKAEENQCNSVCRHESAMCGGRDINSVFCSKPYKVRFLGCFKDKNGDRDFPLVNERTALKGNQSPERCSLFCWSLNVRFMALQYGGECYCGDTFGKHGKATNGSCNMSCKADSGSMCGGKLFNSVYEIDSSKTGHPLPPKDI